MTIISVTVILVEFTLDELTAEVAAQLSQADFAQGNGQVSPVPDRRTLRYYTTIGLLDRPFAMRGRQAVYGDRHILQAVAVKRLQAAGLALADIQRQLAGLPDEQLIALTRTETSPRRTERFWAAAPLANPAASMSVTPRQEATPTPDDVRPLIAVPLDPDVTLLLPGHRPLPPGEVAAIRQAAAPLLAHLASSGWTGPQADRTND
jgi:DNA-binding transcriptional MerR regulator